MANIGSSEMASPSVPKIESRADQTEAFFNKRIIEKGTWQPVSPTLKEDLLKKGINKQGEYLIHQPPINNPDGTLTLTSKGYTLDTVGDVQERVTSFTMRKNGDRYDILDMTPQYVPPQKVGMFGRLETTSNPQTGENTNTLVFFEPVLATQPAQTQGQPNI